MAELSPIRRLIAEKEFRIVYQPVVDLKTHKIFAYEALVRSKTPDFTSPPQMFDAAVADGCTGKLGRALRDVSVEDCPDYRLFLNIHPAELNEGFLVQPNDPIFRHGLDVYLEITEGVPLSHFSLCQNILSEVRGRGVFLVVDDLGAGYSNLKYIADLQPKVVKLDRGLVAGLTNDSRLFKLVSAIVVLCHELDAMVVAEGIEEISELIAVRDAGANYGQGYLLARPAFPPPPVTWPDLPTPSERPTQRRPSAGLKKALQRKRA
jgi:EAL domain-containing protein (putative c-di-GMP-specific phosphodiesterase class I)